MQLIPTVDGNIERLELQQTQPAITAAASAMSLLFVLYSGIQISGQEFSTNSFIAIKQTDETAIARDWTSPISDIDLLNVLRKVHDAILVQSVDLDSDAREILSRNLSKLYKYA